ncbi:MAG TPA: hypothetical protein VM427_03640 [Patescibacteria group bacterium]|nr:hypothetical protein [Patescibacteria group bacterium]
MTAPRRSAVRFPLRIMAIIALALLGAACNPSGPSLSSRSPSPSTAPEPSLTAVPGGPSSPAGSAAASVPTTTETDFGRIWDALPASFPTLPGQQPADPGSGPTSGSFIVNMTPDDAARAMAAALTNLGWTADVASALEDGTVVLAADGMREGCASEVRFTPMSGTVVMSVLYGAECPFS